MFPSLIYEKSVVTWTGVRFVPAELFGPLWNPWHVRGNYKNRLAQYCLPQDVSDDVKIIRKNIKRNIPLVVVSYFFQFQRLAEDSNLNVSPFRSQIAEVLLPINPTACLGLFLKMSPAT